MGFFDKIKKNKNKNDYVKNELSNINLDKNQKYEKALKKSRESLIRKIQIFTSKNNEINEQFFEELEELLIMSDLSASYTSILIEEIKKESKIRKITDEKDLLELIIEIMFSSYINEETNTEVFINDDQLNVILVTGVNGVGKTTSIGKLANMYKNLGYKVSLAAADTFRAGAVEQLSVWAERINVEITKPQKEGQDPASVVYESISNAKNNETQILIIDTAGRLQNKVNLMQELKKINEIILRETQVEKIESLLVIDATTGQSGVQQASAFNEVTNLDGIILTKMDSSSKGGIILSIKSLLNIPVKFIGLGESLEDLEKFDFNKYIYGLTSDLLEDEEN